MVRLPVCSGTQAVKAFERLGYERSRQSGSHVRMLCEGREPLTIPQHRELAKGTLRAIIKASGFTVEEFSDKL